MKKYRYTYPVSNPYFPPLEENALFLDIETTGFQRNNTFLTIIGLAWQEKDTIIIEQWMNECKDDLSEEITGINLESLKTEPLEIEFPKAQSLETESLHTESSEAQQLWNLLEEGSLLKGKKQNFQSNKKQNSSPKNTSFQRAESVFQVTALPGNTSVGSTSRHLKHQNPPLSFKEKGFLEERLLLKELEKFLTAKEQLPILVHYNGTTFDLPYLKSKYKQYKMTTSLSACCSLDLYQYAKKYRYFLQTDGLKQKNLEEVFGLFREDCLTGQELIQTYLKGIDKQNDRFLNLYLIHNREDMEGMVLLQNLLKVDSFFQGNFQIVSWEKKDPLSCLMVQLNCGFNLKFALSTERSGIHFHRERNSLYLKIPFVSMEAKYFYPDYKNYYYLPLEDRAIHKSVAFFVEKEYREKAAKDNCYVKKTGIFYPLPFPSTKKARKESLESCCEMTLFYEQYNGSTAYLLASELENEHNRMVYLKNILRVFLESCKR